VLFGVFVLLLVLVLCMCLGKSGGGISIPIPDIPTPPGLSKIASILRVIAASLRDIAAGIDTANGVVNQAREKLESVTDFKVKKPILESKGSIRIGPWDGEVYAIVGFEDVSPFDDETKEKLNTFANDVTGKAVLDGASSKLYEKADTLDQQANNLDSQS
jgi:hypothetical protein